MITANDLKLRGVKAIEENLNTHQELGITVRGKMKYIILTIEQYEKMRNAELELSYNEIINEIEKGEYTTSIEDHIKELTETSKNAHN
jgi:hypothetical protein